MLKFLIGSGMGKNDVMLPFSPLVGAGEGTGRCVGRLVCRALSFLGVLLQSLIARGKGQAFSHPFATLGQALLMFCLSDGIMGAGSPEGTLVLEGKETGPAERMCSLQGPSCLRSDKALTFTSGPPSCLTSGSCRGLSVCTLGSHLAAAWGTLSVLHIQGPFSSPELSVGWSVSHSESGYHVPASGCMTFFPVGFPGWGLASSRWPIR